MTDRQQAGRRRKGGRGYERSNTRMVEQEWHGQFDEIGDSILMIEMN